MGFFSEFKAFAMRGNVVDLAVGVIIGGAFGKIVSSLVNDIIMPPIGVALGGVNFKELAYVLKPAAGEVAAVSINYGSFIQTIIDFVIIAMAVFVMIRTLNKASAALARKKQEEEAAPAAPAGPTQEELLAEIRDLLKTRS
jgi:large conductance mechanosensitive channel